MLSLWLFAVRRDGRLGLLDLAILASASLLPVYHRFMDAGILLIPVAWALSELEGELRKLRGSMPLARKSVSGAGCDHASRVLA